VNNTSSYADLDLVWTGTGMADRDSYNETTQLPGVTITSHSQGAIRDGVCSGSVIWLGTDVTPEPTAFAFLQKNAFTEVTITRIKPAATTTTLSSSPNPSSLNQAVTFIATLATSDGTPVTSGDVFLTELVGLGSRYLADPVPVNANGEAVFSVSSLTQGSHSIRASYGGTSEFQWSQSPLLEQIVQ